MGFKLQAIKTIYIYSLIWSNNNLSCSRMALDQPKTCSCNFSNNRNQIITQVLIDILHCSSLRSSAYTLLQNQVLYF